MATLFVSHSSEDRAYVERLRDLLIGRGFSFLFLSLDPERGIAPGMKWEQELYSQLRRADAVLFVGSPASLASQWCFAELAMARCLGKTIVPVKLRGNGSHPLLHDTQGVDLSVSDERGLDRLHDWLCAAGVDPRRMPHRDPRRSPFPGLEAFEERDAAVFFGRQKETDWLVGQMLSKRRYHTERLVAVVGASGSGKSSLVRAGLLPRLRRVQRPWVVLSVLRPGDRPLHQLALALEDALKDAKASPSLQSIEQTLDEGASGLVRLAEQLSHLHPGESKPPVLVFVDQAEELIAPAAGEEHARFVDLLHRVTRGDGDVWSVLTLRSEYLNAFLHAKPDVIAFDGKQEIGPLDNARLMDVIERPAHRAGMEFERRLVNQIVDDTGDRDALPLLAHTLATLYDDAQGRGERTITIEDYQRLGGVVGALRRTADSERERLAGSGLGDLVVPTLKRLVALGPDGQPTRRRISRAAFDGKEDRIVAAYIEARLLTSTRVGDQSTVEVAHEALFRQWPPLKIAIDSDRETLQLRSELEHAAAEWHQHQRAPEYLLSGDRLAVATGLSDASPRAAHDLSRVAQAFLAASRQRQRRLADAARRRTQRTVAILAGGLVFVAALALVAWFQSRRANDARDTAQSERLATDALAESTANPAQSLVLGMQAYARKPTQLAESALRVAVSRATPELILRGHQGSLSAVAAAPDGRHLASAGADGTVRIWDWRSPHTTPTVLPDQGGPINDIAFDGDGRYLASAPSDGSVRIWDRLAPRAPPIVVLDDPKDVNLVVALAHDGRHVAGAGAIGGVRVWDLTVPGSSPTVQRADHPPATAVVFADDGRRVATAGGDGTLRVWDWRVPRLPTTILSRDAPFVTAIAFAGDERHLASAGNDKRVRVWAWRRPHSKPMVLRGDHQGPVRALAFAPDGRHLASAGDDGTLRVWDWRAPGSAPTLLRSSQRPVRALSFVGDGRHLASVGGDGTVRVWEWRLPRSEPTIMLGQHSGPVFGIGFSPDGHQLASSGDDNLVRVWDRRSPRTPPTILRGSRQPFIDGVAFTDDGRHLASADTDGTVRIWDRRTPRSPPTDLPGNKPVRAIAFAADGRHLASAEGDGRVRVRNWRAPRAAPSLMRGAPASVQAAAFDDDGYRLVSADDHGTVRVWDWRAPQAPPTVLRGNQPLATSMAFEAGGRHVAGSGHDGTIRVWDLLKPRSAPVVLRGDRSLVASVAFAGDGRNLAGTGSDGTVRVWDWRAPRVPPTVLRGDRLVVTAVAFAHDGRLLAGAGNDGTVQVWNCLRCGDIEHVRELARARAPREIRP
jgi:WD40 repeat protein